MGCPPQPNPPLSPWLRQDVRAAAILLSQILIVRMSRLYSRARSFVSEISFVSLGPSFALPLPPSDDSHPLLTSDGLPCEPPPPSIAMERVMSMEEMVQRDESRLLSLGYAQVLSRGFQAANNFCVVVSSVALVVGFYASFSIALQYGGPVSALYGWLICAVGTLATALALAELSSAFPTSGGVYFYASALVKPSLGPVFAWVMGWTHLLGQCSALSSVLFTTAKLISTIILLGSGSGFCCGNAVEAQSPGSGPDRMTPGPGYVVNQTQTYFIYLGFILIITVLASLPQRWTGFINIIGGWYNIGWTLSLIISIPLISTLHPPVEWALAEFDSSFPSDNFNINDRTYIFIVGLLFSAYSQTGFDGPCHLSEETVASELSAPKAIVWGVVYCLLTGFLWIISLLFSIPNYLFVLGQDPRYYSHTNGDAIPQIFIDAFIQRSGSSSYLGGTLLSLVILGSLFFCCFAYITYISRIAFCYARDKALPLSFLLTQVSSWSSTPLYSIWAVAILCSLLGLLMLISLTAFNALVSLATIGLSATYAVPIAARIICRDRFKPGPWNLGKYSIPIGSYAVLWTVFLVIGFSLPTVYPVTLDVFNWSGVMLLGLLFVSLVCFYFPGIGAYRWFKGPQVNLQVQDVPEASSRQDLPP